MLDVGIERNNKGYVCVDHNEYTWFNNPGVYEFTTFEEVLKWLSEKDKENT